MIIKNFRLQIIMRVLAISATAVLFSLLLLQTEFYATSAVAGCAVGLQVYALIRFVDRTNRDLARFLLAIRYGDYPKSVTTGTAGKSFEELNKAFNEITAFIKKQRTENEEKYWYLQAVIRHIGIGLIAFRQNGDIDLINDTAKKLLRAIRHENGGARGDWNLRNIQSLRDINKTVADAVNDLKGGGKKIVAIQTADNIFHLVIYASVFIIGGDSYLLVSLQNIGRELEEKEMEAWQKLIRVLTHEIMNSVTPIASLASTGKSLSRNLLDDETSNDVRSAFQTIEKRSEGLLHFVDAYRHLTRIPQPAFQTTTVGSLIDSTYSLLKQQIEEYGISFRSEIKPENIEITADPELIQQVLINLIKNSIDALKGKTGGVIRLTGGLDPQGRVVIKVADNGHGIAQEAIDKIFIPFFTTKEHGSGIGLSLSRQIMRLHGGSISVRSVPGEETGFFLRF